MVTDAPPAAPAPAPRVVRRYVDLHGIVALVLATSVGATVVLLAVETITHGGPVSEAEATVLSTIAGAGVGAVATYLGVRGSGPAGDRGGTDGDTPD